MPITPVANYHEASIQIDKAIKKGQVDGLNLILDNLSQTDIAMLTQRYPDAVDALLQGTHTPEKHEAIINTMANAGLMDVCD